MIRGIHHVAISTPNMDRLLGFYRDLLGFKEVGTAEWSPGTTTIDKVLGLKDSAARQVMLKAANLCIELFEFKNPEPKPLEPMRPVCNHGHTHLCLDVVDIDTVYNRLKDAGVHFHAPPQDFGSVRATYGRDPDGNVFEIQEIISADDPAQVFG